MSIRNTSLKSLKSLKSLSVLRAGPSRRYASDAPQYNQPTGYLFGEKPLKPGEKRKRESWELIYNWGMGGCFVFAVVVYIYKPRTNIQDWALEEAKRRMEARGDLPKYIPSNQRTQE